MRSASGSGGGSGSGRGQDDVAVASVDPLAVDLIGVGDRTAIIVGSRPRKEGTGGSANSRVAVDDDEEKKLLP